MNWRCLRKQGNDGLAAKAALCEDGEVSLRISSLQNLLSISLDKL
jgi:hypothetical protein